MDTAWLSVLISIAGIIGSGFSAYFGVKIAVVRLEERFNALERRCEEDRALLAMTKEVHDKRLATHELEIGLLKRGQPLDYAQR